MIKPETIKKAWKMREAYIWTMREIADKLGVDRIALIDAMVEEGMKDGQESPN